MHDDSGWMWGHDWGSGGGIALGVVMVVLLAALVIAMIAAVRYLATPQPGPGQPPSAQDRSRALLAERFARGEIDEEEYRRRIAVLREHG
ncbi:MAG: SHOCT domain-containing protein [Actinomycetia bacterium]|nr:SHOCT domain-containing protein [Actinomycetes bacterium]MCH9759395.1 SHOCT domain-containing protein [Actinomycetes bacterium]